MSLIKNSLMAQLGLSALLLAPVTVFAQDKQSPEKPQSKPARPDPKPEPKPEPKPKPDAGKLSDQELGRKAMDCRRAVLNKFRSGQASPEAVAPDLKAFEELLSQAKEPFGRMACQIRLFVASIHLELKQSGPGLKVLDELIEAVGAKDMGIQAYQMKVSYLMRNKQEKKVDALIEATKDAKVKAQLKIFKVSTLMDMGQLDPALAILEAMIKGETDKEVLAQAQLMKSRVILEKGEADKALEVLDALIKTQEKGKVLLEAYNMKARICVEKRDIPGFMKLTEEAKAKKLDAQFIQVLESTVYILKAQDFSRKGDKKALQKLIAEAKEAGMEANIINMLEGELKKSSYAIGREFPDFKVTGLDGKPLSLSQYRGKVVLLDFWATWCGPCVAELPHVKKAYAAYKDKGFVIIGISLDNDKAKLAAFIKREGMNWRQFFDGKGWQNELAVKYGIDSIPATFLIGVDGKIIGKDLRGEALGQAVEKALKATKKAAKKPAGESKPEASEPTPKKPAAPNKPAPATPKKG